MTDVEREHEDILKQELESMQGCCLLPKRGRTITVVDIGTGSM